MGRLSNFTDYRNPIVSRNFFGVYVLPTPPPPDKQERKPPPPVDLAEHAYVSGFTEVDGAQQVWLQDRIAGKPWILETGQSFTVGNRKGTVESIHPDGEVIIQFDGHRRLLHLNDMLYGGEEIHAATPNQPVTRTNPKDR